jgi:hypothetical protein
MLGRHTGLRVSALCERVFTGARGLFEPISVRNRMDIEGGLSHAALFCAATASMEEGNSNGR